MIATKNISDLPKTLEEFQNWEQTDSFKYEWNDGELIKFNGINKLHLKIYQILLKLFVKKGLIEFGTLVAEQDVWLSGIQMRRPDIAYFTDNQVDSSNIGNEEIPEFVIEIISGNDNINKVEEKIVEYYKAGVEVVWLIMPENEAVHIYTSRKNVKICTEKDVCSAAPVLPDFEIRAEDIFAK
jgi:Uma2 family endonuclease